MPPSASTFPWAISFLKSQLNFHWGSVPGWNSNLLRKFPPPIASRVPAEFCLVSGACASVNGTSSIPLILLYSIAIPKSSPLPGIPSGPSGVTKNSPSNFS